MLISKLIGEKEKKKGKDTFEITHLSFKLAFIAVNGLSHSSTLSISYEVPRSRVNSCNAFLEFVCRYLEKLT